MCGPTSAQTEISDEQQQLLKDQIGAYNDEYGAFKGILGNLTSSFTPILNAGINQEGYNAQEKAALNSQATEGTAETYSKAASALNNQIAAQGGGNVPITSGANQQLQEQLSSSAAANEAATKNQIVQSDYDVGRQNYLTAAQELGSAASLENPIGFSNSATSSGEATANEANTIAQEQDAWLQPLTAALGGITSSVIQENPGNVFGK